MSPRAEHKSSWARTLLGQPVGAFVHRSADGNGTINCTAMSLKWNYAATGLGGTNAVDVSVHAIEMVYIPQGAFYAGSGGSGIQRFLRRHESRAAVSNHQRGGHNGRHKRLELREQRWQGGDLQGPIPAAYPKGYNAFYMMKYEISQGQYADFLNFLDPGMAPTRFYERLWLILAIPFRKPGCSIPATRRTAPAITLTWPDLITYLKWAALAADG